MLKGKIEFKGETYSDVEMAIAGAKKRILQTYAGSSFIVTSGFDGNDDCNYSFEIGKAKEIMEKYKEVRVVCPNCKREIRIAIEEEKEEEKMEKRKIGVEIGEKSGCLINDRISVEFSPNELKWLKEIFEVRALKAGTYSRQTEERDMVEVFDEAYRTWREERKEGDEKAGYAV